MDEKAFENFWVSWYRENFQEQLEKLKTVETREELDEQTLRLKDAKAALLRNDPSFQKFMRMRENDMKNNDIVTRREKLKEHIFSRNDIPEMGKCRPIGELGRRKTK